MALSKQMAEEVGDNVNADLQRVRAALPGLGEPEPVTVPAGAVANGRTLGDIDLRGATGATVLAIVRKGGEEVLLPNGHESLAEGDVVFLAGTQNAINAARSILRSPIHNQAARAHRLNKH
jgi:CPA2 family monovalent cation:H+ antiporter-2